MDAQTPPSSVIPSSEYIPPATSSDSVGLNALVRRAATEADEQLLDEAEEVVRLNMGAVPPHPMARSANTASNWRQWMPSMMEWRRLFGPRGPYYQLWPNRPAYKLPKWSEWRQYHRFREEMERDGSLPLHLPSLLEHHREMASRLRASHEMVDCEICYTDKKRLDMVRKKNCNKVYCKDCHRKVRS